MADQLGPSQPDPTLYPDILLAGDLRNALQAEFDTADLAAQVRHVSAPGWRYVAAEVRNAERHVDVVIGSRERAFILQFWTRGVGMANGTAQDLPAVAAAMHGWQSGMPVRQLVSAWPFLKTNGFAEAFERGDAEAIDYRWRRYHENSPPAPQLTRLQPVIAVAFREPRLRALLPYTSHWSLHFSRTVSHPYSRDCPSIRPLGDDRFLVTTADRHKLGATDAAGAVKLVLTVLSDQPARLPRPGTQ